MRSKFIPILRSITVGLSVSILQAGESASDHGRWLRIVASKNATLASIYHNTKTKVCTRMILCELSNKSILDIVKLLDLVPTVEEIHCGPIEPRLAASDWEDFLKGLEQCKNIKRIRFSFEVPLQFARAIQLSSIALKVSYCSLQDFSFLKSGTESLNVYVSVPASFAQWNRIKTIPKLTLLFSNFESAAEFKEKFANNAQSNSINIVVNDWLDSE